VRLIYKRGRERLSFPLDEGDTTIGRKDYCEIYFPDGSLSKRHARLIRSGRKLVLVDAGSRNGTFLNGEMIAGEEVLANGTPDATAAATSAPRAPTPAGTTAAATSARRARGVTQP
jgi:pSer/pThr/pTyr-binding forkhead associated (FHA) protein